MNALLFKHDSTYGAYEGTVDHTDDALIIDGREIKVLQAKDPATLPWGDMGVDIVLESTGIFTDAEKARCPHPGRCQEGDHQRPREGRGHHHRPRGQRGQVRPREPPRDQQRQLHDELPGAGGEGRPRRVRYRARADEHDPQLHERPADPRRCPQGPAPAWAAGQNIIPTTTGAAKALALVILDLKGKFDGFSLRVPTPTVSVVDFTADVTKSTSADEINDAFRAAAEGPMKGILGVSTNRSCRPISGATSRSSIIDSASTMVLGGTMVKVIAWYDNEWGYSSRCADLVSLVASKLPSPPAPRPDRGRPGACPMDKLTAATPTWPASGCSSASTSTSRSRTARSATIPHPRLDPHDPLPRDPRSAGDPRDHLGRPDGKVQDGLRLRPVAERLSQILGRNVPVTGDALGIGTSTSSGCGTGRCSCSRTSGSTARRRRTTRPSPSSSRTMPSCT